MLLAIDAGVKLGWAVFNDEGQLIRFGSRNIGAKANLKKTAWAMLHQVEGLKRLVVEGGGDIAEVWIQTAQKMGLLVMKTHAEVWREALLKEKQRRSGVMAKEHALKLARNLMCEAGLPPPKTFRHDAAEAILVGYWASQDGNWAAFTPL